LVSRPLRVAFLPLVLLLALIVACGDDADCMWPGRPDCQPVGTTLVVTDTRPDDPLCGSTQYFDEIGEAAFRVEWCS
jgi:hypothetical protein